MKRHSQKDGKLLIIINGKGGVGKDTLCGFAAARYPVRNVSSITPIKAIAAANGWNGEKTPEARRFLADLKEAFIRYNDLPTRYLLEQYREFLAGSERIMFAHIRETGEIEKLKRLVAGPCVTLLVRRGSQVPAAWGNQADDETEAYDYDYIYENDLPLEQAEADFLTFLDERLLSGSVSRLRGGSGPADEEDGARQEKPENSGVFRTGML